MSEVWDWGSESSGHLSLLLVWCGSNAPNGASHLLLRFSVLSVASTDWLPAVESTWIVQSCWEGLGLSTLR